MKKACLVLGILIAIGLADLPSSRADDGSAGPYYVMYIDPSGRAQKESYRNKSLATQRMNELKSRGIRVYPHTHGNLKSFNQKAKNWNAGRRERARSY